MQNQGMFNLIIWATGIISLIVLIVYHNSIDKIVEKFLGDSKCDAELE